MNGKLIEPANSKGIVSWFQVWLGTSGCWGWIQRPTLSSSVPCWITNWVAAAARLRVTQNERTVDVWILVLLDREIFKIWRHGPNRKVIKFRKDKYRILPFALNNAICEYSWNWQGKKLYRKHPGDWVERLTKS